MDNIGLVRNMSVFLRDESSALASSMLVDLILGCYHGLVASRIETRVFILSVPRREGPLLIGHLLHEVKSSMRKA